MGGCAGFLHDKFAVLWYLVTDAVCTLYIIKYYMEDHCNLYSSPHTVRVIKSRRVRWIGPCDMRGRGEMFIGLLLGKLKERDP
jgi:hypothetical protein